MSGKHENATTTKWILKSLHNITKIIPLVKPLSLVGRSPIPTVDISCRSDIVSRKHAEITILADGTIYIMDCKSANGTFVNNQKIPPENIFALNVLDEIGFGMSSTECFQRNNDLSTIFTLHDGVPTDTIITIDDDSLDIIEKSESGDKQKTNDNVALAKASVDIEISTEDDEIDKSDEELISNTSQDNSLIIINKSELKKTKDVANSDNHFIANHDNLPLVTSSGNTYDNLLPATRNSKNRDNLPLLTSIHNNHDNLPRITSKRNNDDNLPLAVSDSASHDNLPHLTSNRNNNDNLRLVVSDSASHDNLPHLTSNRNNNDNLRLVVSDSASHDNLPHLASNRNNNDNLRLVVSDSASHDNLPLITNNENDCDNLPLFAGCSHNRDNLPLVTSNSNNNDKMANIKMEAVGNQINIDKPIKYVKETSFLTNPTFVTDHLFKKPTIDANFSNKPTINPNLSKKSTNDSLTLKNTTADTSLKKKLPILTPLLSTFPKKDVTEMLPSLLEISTANVDLIAKKIKQEVISFTSKTSTGYKTDEDGCILIDSDDEDNIMCSQACNDNVRESDFMPTFYSQMKQELDQLDRLDGTPPPIDLDCDEFDNVSLDWFDEIDLPKDAEKNDESNVEINDERTVEQNVEKEEEIAQTSVNCIGKRNRDTSEIQEEITSRKTCVNDNKESSDNDDFIRNKKSKELKKSITNKQTTTEVDNSTATTKTKTITNTVDNSVPSTSKSNKIEPLIILEKLPVKRRAECATVELETKRSKIAQKTGNNLKNARSDIKGIQTELGKRKTKRRLSERDRIPKSKKIEIQEKRKEMLKALTVAGNKEVMVVEETANVCAIQSTSTTDLPGDLHRKGTAKIKVSSGRGNFLLNCNSANTRDLPPIIEPHHQAVKAPAVKGRRKALVPKSKDKDGACKSKLVDSVKNSKNQSKISDESLVSSRSVLECAESEPRRLKYGQRSSLKVAPPIRSVKFTANSPTTHPRNTIPTPNTSTIIQQQQQQRRRPSQDCRNLLPEVILTVLGWNYSWFVEQTRNVALPPLFGKTDVSAKVKRMANTFKDYKSYADSVKPLMYVELWQSVFSEWQAQGDKGVKFKASIQNTDALQTHTDLHCISYISTEQRARNEHIKDGSLVNVCVRSKKDRRFRNVYLGYVHKVDRTIIRPNDSIDEKLANSIGVTPSFFLTFTISIAKSTKGPVDYDDYVQGNVISLVSSNIRLFNSVRYLKYSPLLPFILEPTIQKYNVNLPSELHDRRFLQDDLNENQIDAVLEGTHISLRKDPGIYLIDGPPGTGKTSVIVNIIQKILFSAGDGDQRKILLTAPSNGAVDNIVIKLLSLKKTMSDENRKKFKLVRIGQINSIHPDVKHLSIDEYSRSSLTNALCASNPILKAEFDSLLSELTVLKAQRGVTSVDQFELKIKIAHTKKVLDNIAKNHLKFNYNRRFALERKLVVNSCNIICSTLSSCFRMTADGDVPLDRRLTCCIVDEATQSCEQESLIPLMLDIDKLILVGDPQQLPAVTESMVAREHGYGQSLFARIQNQLTAATISQLFPILPIRRLLIQYRMHAHIAHYPNVNFYSGRLTNADCVADRGRPIASPVLRRLRPYLVVQQTERDDVASQQYQCVSEVTMVCGAVRTLVEMLRREEALGIVTIGVITPYSKQRDMLTASVNALRIGPEEKVKISCNTVDGFQGQEKDIILISCVRQQSNAFIRNEHRLNVALTRAKHALYIIGSENLFEDCKVLRPIREDARNRGLLVSANETTHFKSVLLR